jgi:hypothetical protein
LGVVSKDFDTVDDDTVDDDAVAFLLLPAFFF